ncbi:MAG: hypothetical protein MI861_14370, partial [Pirellulales bacterium]|nr:hypothetical protein [Pirellulales bacterium]
DTLVRRPHRGSTILTFGLLSLGGGFFSCGCCALFFPLGVGFAIAAITMANQDLLAMQQGVMDPSGMENTKAGSVCAKIGLAVSLLALLIFVVTLAVNVFVELA